MSEEKERTNLTSLNLKGVRRLRGTRTFIRKNSNISPIGAKLPSELPKKTK